jgi:hypothetical protein
MSPSTDPNPVTRSRRMFLATVTSTAAVLLGWAATGQPFPGAVIAASTRDLTNPTNIVGVWDVAPSSVAIERLDGVAIARDWTGITARYSNADGSVQIFNYVSNQPFGPPPTGTTVDDATGIVRYTDSTGTHGSAIHWSLPGRRYAGISVWATKPPADLDEFLVAIAEHHPT